MHVSTKKWYYLGSLILFAAILLAFSPFFTRPLYASSSNAKFISSIGTGYTTNWAHVRLGPTTSYTIVATYAPGTTVTIYASVSGQVIWSGISTWYRISSPGSSPQYIYSGLVTRSTGEGSGGTSPSATGKEIVVSLSQQWLYAYQNGVEVFNTAVMTGRPALATPTGTYHVFAKLSPTTFYSPWPYGSPYWYPPTHINYALEWHAGGYFLHDSWWHSVYGPGTNGWHYDPAYGWQWGTHGCVAMALNAAAWLYNWAPIGTTVQVNP